MGERRVIGDDYVHIKDDWTKKEDQFLRRWWNVQPPTWDGWEKLLVWHTWNDVCRRADELWLEGGDKTRWTEREDEYVRHRLIAISNTLGKSREEVLRHVRNMVL